MSFNSTTRVVLVSSDGSKLYSYYGAISFLVIAIISWMWIGGRSDPKEPPQLSPKFPFLGHLLGIIQHQAEYFMQLSSRQSRPIFTLKIFRSRIYVITSPELVQAVFRMSKALSFEPIASKGSARILQIGKETFKKLTESPNDNIHSNYVDLVGKGMHASMQAGAPLLQMNMRALNRFAVFLNEIDTDDKELDLYKWVRDSFTLASADAMYGKENPISDDPSLIQSLEDFETSIGILFLNVLPSITARKGVLARLAYAKAFESYYERGLCHNASGLIQGRYRDIIGSGCTYKDVASVEIAIVMATTMNSVNGAFWMLCHVLSDPALANELREEVMAITTRRNADGIEEIRFDVSQLQKSCPLLTSTWQETLRTEDVIVSQRVVMEDTMLDDTYLLKKNSIVQIPARVMHESPAIWGADSHVFNARRFLKASVDATSREQKKLQKQGFIPFGGGAVLCPGRHFATTETLGIVATILLGYELRMADGGGPLKLPRAKKQEMGVAVKIPESGLDVVIKRKKEFQGVKWTYDVGGDVSESDMVF